MRSRHPVTLRIALLAGAAILVAVSPLWAGPPAGRPAQAGEPLPTIQQATAGMEVIDGFVPMYWDETTGALWLEISRFETEILYISGLSAGLGSNDIGLDRGQTRSRLVMFQRVGPKVFLVQPNYRYRAETDDPDERRAVDEAFAQSILWGFTVAAESDSRTLVDATDFLLRDAHGVIPRLRDDGDYRIDVSRSGIHLPRTKGFPRNSEIDVTLTYVTSPRGGGGFSSSERRATVASVAPTAEAVTLRQHHSLVELPGDGYTPREYDPRSGFGSITFQDYAAPLTESMTKRLIRRHRLQKADPSADVSEAVEPIVYYLDRGTPEPIRSALLEGARWWNEAFEAAGYRNAFRVELMPEGADSFDVRYNVINWVHRSTRGWSSGGSITDPRTGEIIKGVVTLGSLRVRQDYLIAEGLLSPYVTGDETPPALAEMALARLRQLSAHEVGHTLGLGHNYYASSQGRISVMDYPHPLVTMGDDGTFDLSDAYDVGIGEWDKVAIAYGYQEFEAGTREDEALEVVLDDAWARDLRYLTNQDTGAHPRVHQWANGTDPAAELNRVMALRRAALDRFGERAIRRGAPMASLEEVLVPLYLHHRYQVEAAASALAGMHYVYALRGDGRDPVRAVPPSEQQAALEALLDTLAPSELAIPSPVLDVLPPRPAGFGRHRELFPRHTGAMFDPITPAVVAARHTVAMMLQPERTARLVAQRATDESLPGLHAVLDGLLSASFGVTPDTPYEAEIGRAVERVVVDGLMQLAGSAPMPQVRAITSHRLDQVMGRLLTDADGQSDADEAHYRLLAADIGRFLDRPVGALDSPSAPPIPPGSPIGDPGRQWLDPAEPYCSAGWADEATR